MLLVCCSHTYRRQISIREAWYHHIWTYDSKLPMSHHRWRSGLENHPKHEVYFKFKKDYVSIYKLLSCPSLKMIPVPIWQTCFTHVHSRHGTCTCSICRWLWALSTRMASKLSNNNNNNNSKNNDSFYILLSSLPYYTYEEDAPLVDHAYCWFANVNHMSN